MIAIEVHVPEDVDELTDPKIADLRDHVREQRVRCDIERDAEENVGAPLVELATESPIIDVKLEQAVARRERHLPRPHVLLWTHALVREDQRIPRGDDEPPRIQIGRAAWREGV